MLKCNRCWFFGTDHVTSLDGSERREYAEKIATAFFKSMPTESADLSSDDDSDLLQNKLV